MIEVWRIISITLLFLNSALFSGLNLGLMGLDCNNLEVSQSLDHHHATTPRRRKQEKCILRQQNTTHPENGKLSALHHIIRQCVSELLPINLDG